MANNYHNILIFGSTGQVGSNLVDIYKNKAELILPSRSEVDFNSPETISEFFANLQKKPDMIINACAYTLVDKAEEEIEICDNVNHQSVSAIAKYCTKYDIPIIHYSTDYVYNGEGEDSFFEDDASVLMPLSVYGKTKLAGDKILQKTGCSYIIMRTSWVYNHAGSNFLKSILKLASEREELKIVSDQVGSPTYAYDLAKVTENIISQLGNFSEFPSGVYHACPSEQISWYDFAKRIVKYGLEEGQELKVKNILPIPTSEYPTPAKRPLNSRLSVVKLDEVFGIKFPELDKSLKIAIGKILKNGE